MKKKASRNIYHPTLESRQALGKGVTIVVSIFFMVLGYLLLKSDIFLWQIFGYVAFIWGAMGVGYGLWEIYKAIKQR